MNKDENITRRTNLRSVRARYNCLWRDFVERVQVESELQELINEESPNSESTSSAKVTLKDTLLIRILKIPRMKKESKRKFEEGNLLLGYTVGKPRPKVMVINQDRINHVGKVVLEALPEAPRVLPPLSHTPNLNDKPSDSSTSEISSSSSSSLFNDLKRSTFEQFNYEAFQNLFASDEEDNDDTDGNESVLNVNKFGFDSTSPTISGDFSAGALSKYQEEKLKLATQKMKWKWEYLMNCEIQNRLEYRQKKLEIFKSLKPIEAITETKQPK